MTALRAEAIKIINQIPDERMSYVVDKLKNLQEDDFNPFYTEDPQKRKAAYEEIQKIMAPYRHKFPADFDYKKELQKYREESLA